MAVILTGCQKEIEAPVSTHKVIFHANQVESKTTVAEVEGQAVFSWTEEDMDNFHVFENGNAATTIFADYDKTTGVATILAEFPDVSSAPYTYTGFLAGATAQDGKYPAIPAEQTVGDKLYASSCDVLVAEPLQSATVADELTFAFKRPVSVGKMTITNLPVGDVVENVTITADKSILGYFNSDTDAWVADGDQVINVIVNKTVPEGGSIDVGFVSMPFEGAILTVKVSTDNKNYSKTFAKTLSLVDGRLVAFKVNMSGCEAPLFYESFDKCDGSGGNDGSWSGSIATADLTSEKLDNAGWSYEKGNAAKECAKFGTGSVQGYAVTPALGLKSGKNATITFKAGAWSGDKTEDALVLEVIGNGFLSDYVQSINDGAWTDISVVITGGDADTKLKISAAQSSKNRFFLDDVKAEVGGDPFTYILIDPTDTTVASSCTGVDIDLISNGSWTAVSKNGNTISPASGNGNATVTLTIPENKTSQEYKDTVTFTASDKVVKFALTQQPGATATITIAEFIELADTENDHHLRGCVSGISGKNFTLTDKTGSIYVYSFVDNIVFAEGDTLTMYGKYLYYEKQSKHEVVSGRYVSHSATPKLSVDKSTIDVASDETSATFNITSNTSWTVVSSNPDVTVNPASGEGNAEITLSFSENESTSSTVTSTITVSSSTPGVISSPCEIAFTQAKKETGTLKTEDLPASTTFTYSGSEDTGILTFDNGDFTIVQAKGSSSTKVNSSYNTVGKLRVYVGNTLTFSSAFSIKKIEITSSQGTVSVNTGKLTTSTSTKQVWEGSAKNVVFTPSVQWRTTTIKVTYLSNAAPIEVTDKSINTNGSVDVSTMFSSPSSGAFTYELTENPGSAGKIESGVFSATAAGTYKVKATQAAAGDYTHVGTAIGTITVIEPTWTLQSIAITTPPTKTEYEAGEKFNPEGMVVTGTFKDETEVVKSWAVTGYTYPTEALTKGTESAKISYTYGDVTKDTYQTISVVDPTTVWILESIAVTQAPTKTSYKVGDELDLTGMVVTGTYSDQEGIKPQKQETVTGWTSDPANGSTLSTAGDVTVTITYEGKETTQKVTVAGAAQEYSCTFSSKSWAVASGGTISWGSDKDASAHQDKGEQVYATNSGAGATTTHTYSNITKVRVYACTTSKGVGNITIKVGTGTAQTICSLSKNATQTWYELEYSTPVSGKVTFVVNCSTNSMYLQKVEIIAENKTAQ